MTKFSLTFFFLFIFWSSALAYHYNDFPYSANWKKAPKYPDWCCPLEWTNMTQGEELPKDWIHAGTFMGRDFAFSRTVPNFYTALKSSNPIEAAYAYVFSTPNPFPILTNPNQCHIDWYTTKYSQDIPPTNESIFYPTTGRTPYGSYAQYQNIPGWMSENGIFWKMKSLTESEGITKNGMKLLYVDCLKSVTKMSTAKLVRLKFDEETLNKLKSSSARKQMVKKVFRNSSPEKSKVSFKFSVITTNTVNLTLNSDHSTSFVSNIDTYQEWINSQRINDLLNDAHFDNGLHDHKKMWLTTDGANDQVSSDIFGVYHREVFDFEQEITLPATSSVTITAYANPIVGRVPFEAVYELTAIKAGDNLITPRLLNQTLTKYGKQKIVEITNRGTVSVTFDGIININSGNDVHLDIKSVPINNLSESYGFLVGVPTNETDFPLSTQ